MFGCILYNRSFQYFQCFVAYYTVISDTIATGILNDNDGMIEHMKHFGIGSDPITMHLLFP